MNWAEQGQIAVAWSALVACVLTGNLKVPEWRLVRFGSRTKTQTEKQLAALIERLAGAELENQHLIPPD